MQSTIRLKGIVTALGGRAWLQERLAAHCVHCSARAVSRACREGALPKHEPERLRTGIDKILVAAGYDPARAWEKEDGDTARASVDAETASGTRSGQDGKPTTPTGAKPSTMNHTKEFLEEEHLRHFGLESDPFFPALGDHRSIWMPDRLRRIKSLIEITVEHQGIMVLTGASGAGKSTLLRHVIGELLRCGKTRVIAPDRLNRSAMTGDMITVSVIEELGGGMALPRAAGQRDKLARNLLAKAVTRGDWPLLVIDESHDLRAGMFIAIKRLWDSGLILSNLAVLLVGQGGKGADGRPEGLRWEIEGNPDLKEFAERCRLVDLGNLADDIPDYLSWRFKRVESDLFRVFEPPAVESLIERGRTLQLVGNLAVKAMREAFRDGDLLVSSVHVERVH